MICMGVSRGEDGLGFRPGSVLPTAPGIREESEHSVGKRWKQWEGWLEDQCYRTVSAAGVLRTKLPPCLDGRTGKGLG